MSPADLPLRDRVRNAVALPAFRQAKQLCFRHLDEGKHLLAFGDQGLITKAANFEATPKADPFEAVKPAADAQAITQPGTAPIVNFGAHNHRIAPRLCHFHELQPELLSEKSAGSFDEAQVSNIVDDTTAIGIEEHYLHLHFDSRRLGIHC